ncbi:hypothetical protein CALVIDRAFT_536225 [Calocera viscosa TUFC12733]|uniref:ATP synthase complex subunit H n=1 Tax=Calocera viscosa (strain TUFC12733) TaxID=1330018 RepID=A0A167NF30_CALVF|nr:hypothetical protein CALVIDRAFT_536225 [Calocera viscosa TUFC12733]
MASLARIVRTAAPRSARCFAVSAATRKDLVQDLYLAQLKAYKPKPQAQDAHVGIVKEYKAPAVPSASALPSDLAAELAKYDSSTPDLADAAPAAKGDSPHAGITTGQFLEMLEEDPHEEVHHH